MLNSYKSHFLQGSHALNTFFIFFFSLIISIFTGGKSIYMIPLVISTTILVINRHEIRSLKFKFNFHWIVFSISVFIFFFYHFIGFDFIGNEINKDILFYGALADFIGKFRIETIEVNIFNGINQHSPWSLYHYSEIWISGIIGNILKTPSIKVLFLFTYPIFCVISYHNLKSFIQKINLIVTPSGFVSSICIFFIILAWIPKGLYPNHFLNQYISFNQFLISGYIKLIVALPFVINALCYFSDTEQDSTDLLVYFLTLFYYPSLIPFGIGLFFFVKIKLFIQKFIKYVDIIILVIFIILGVFNTNLLQPLKMDIVRLGIPSLLLIYLFYKSKININYFNLNLTILGFSIIVRTFFELGLHFFPKIEIFENVDLFQLWSNFTTLLSFLNFFVLIMLIVNSKRNIFLKPKLSFVIIIISPFIISSGQPLKSYVSIVNSDELKSEETYFVLENKLSELELNSWNTHLVYMLINEKHSQFLWESRNFFLINNMKISKLDTFSNLSIYKKEILANRKFLTNLNFMKENHLEKKVIVPIIP